MDLTDPVQLLHSPLGVPQGGGVIGGHHQGAVRAADGQLEAGTQPGGGVDHNIVIAVPGGAQQGPDPGGRYIGGQRHGGGQQGQVGQIRMGNCRPCQGTAPLSHVGEVHQCPVAEAQGDVQIPQADVHVDAQHPLAQPGQTGGDPAGD